MNLTLDEQEAKQPPIVSEREREMASGVHGPLVVASRAPGAGNNNISPRH